MTEETKLRRDVPWLYFLAMLFQMLGGTIAMSYLIFYMTEKMEITVLVMGGVMVAARILDMILGLVAGVAVQKLHLKLGQFRTWLLAGPIVVAVGTTLCFFNAPLPEMGKAIIVLVGYVLYGGGMSFIQLSQNGLLAKIAGPNMNHRMTIAGRIVQGQNAGTIIASATILPLIMFFNARGADGYAVVQLIMAVIGAAFQLPLFFFTKEFDHGEAVAKGAPAPASSASSDVGFGAMFGAVIKNGQLLILLLADTLRWAGIMALFQLPAYFFTYVARNMAMLTPALTIQSVLGFIASLFMPALAKKTGKKGAGVLAGLFSVLFFTELAIFGINGSVFYIIALSGFIVAQALINSCGVNLYLDCGEYQLYKTGKDVRTFIMSMYGIGIKLGFILSSVIVTLVLSLSGYQAVSGAEATVASVPTMALLIGAIPAGLNLLYMLLMLCYGITEDKSREYARANHERAQAAT
jgi:Na+/melibiose symporter-like transporter